MQAKKPLRCNELVGPPCCQFSWVSGLLPPRDEIVLKDEPRSKCAGEEKCDDQDDRRMSTEACCRLCRNALEGCRDMANYPSTHIDAYEIEVISEVSLSSSEDAEDKENTFDLIKQEDLFSRLCSPSSEAQPSSPLCSSNKCSMVGSTLGSMIGSSRSRLYSTSSPGLLSPAQLSPGRQSRIASPNSNQSVSPLAVSSCLSPGRLPSSRRGKMDRSGNRRRSPSRRAARRRRMPLSEPRLDIARQVLPPPPVPPPKEKKQMVYRWTRCPFSQEGPLGFRNGNPMGGDSALCYTPTAAAREAFPDYRFLGKIPSRHGKVTRTADHVRVGQHPRATTHARGVGQHPGASEHFNESIANSCGQLPRKSVLDKYGMEQLRGGPFNTEGRDRNDYSVAKSRSRALLSSENSLELAEPVDVISRRITVVDDGQREKSGMLISPPTLPILGYAKLGRPRNSAVPIARDPPPIPSRPLQVSPEVMESAPVVKSRSGSSSGDETAVLNRMTQDRLALNMAIMDPSNRRMLKKNYGMRQEGQRSDLASNGKRLKPIKPPPLVIAESPGASTLVLSSLSWSSSEHFFRNEINI